MSFVRLFGRIQDGIICFGDLLIFICYLPFGRTVFQNRLKSLPLGCVCSPAAASFGLSFILFLLLSPSFFSIWKEGPKKDQEPLLLRRLTLLCFGLTCSFARDWIFIFRKFLKCNINKGGLLSSNQFCYMKFDHF